MTIKVNLTKGYNKLEIEQDIDPTQDYSWVAGAINYLYDNLPMSICIDQIEAKNGLTEASTQDPMTDKQKNLLIKLGVDVSQVKSKQEAAAIIKEKLSK